MEESIRNTLKFFILACSKGQIEQIINSIGIGYNVLQRDAFWRKVGVVTGLVWSTMTNCFNNTACQECYSFHLIHFQTRQSKQKSIWFWQRCFYHHSSHFVKKYRFKYRALYQRINEPINVGQFLSQPNIERFLNFGDFFLKIDLVWEKFLLWKRTKTFRNKKLELSLKLGREVHVTRNQTVLKGERFWISKIRVFAKKVMKKKATIWPNWQNINI